MKHHYLCVPGKMCDLLIIGPLEKNHKVPHLSFIWTKDILCDLKHLHLYVSILVTFGHKKLIIFMLLAHYMAY